MTFLLCSNYDLGGKACGFTSSQSLSFRVLKLLKCRSLFAPSHPGAVNHNLLRFPLRWFRLATDFWNAGHRWSISVTGVSAELSYSANQFIDSARQAQKPNSSLLPEKVEAAAVSLARHQCYTTSNLLLPPSCQHAAKAAQQAGMHTF